MSNKRLGRALVTIAAMALSAPAAAYITTYLYKGASGCDGEGTSRTCGPVTATAHAFTGGPGNSVVEGAYLGVYGGGLGVSHLDDNPEDKGSPNHAMDNDKFEFIRIDFGEKAVLDKVRTGWVHNDADITVLARSGSAGDPDPNGKTIDGPVPADRLANNGWSLVGHHNGGSGDDQTIDVNPGGTAARYWLIGAFDPDFGSTAGTGADWSKTDKKFDFLKVYAVKWDKPKDAAEPATLLLFAAGLIAWLSAHRRTALI